MSIDTVLLVLGVWFIVGLLSWVVVLARGLRFEVRSALGPSHRELTIPERDARFTAARMHEVALRN